MYAVIRRYKFDPNASEEISSKVSATLLPIIKNVSGFVAYYWLDTGSGEGASLSAFQDKAGAEESVRLAADFVQQHLASLAGEPEIIQGEVQVHA
jgi:hypothetical protein